ncbi:MAG: biotin/lipoyl-binding protein [Clostridia bacterium]|nr:biotin/lipoyl-binding protein [Clostridia bacterium]
MKYVVTLNGKNYEVEVNETEAVVTNVSDAVYAPAPVAAPAPAAAPAPVAAPAPQAVSASGTQIAAPMPGSIININVSVGQAVKAGDVLIILEAMKMENDITAPCDGVVKQIVTTKGATVNTDDVLLVI